MTVSTATAKPTPLDWREDEAICELTPITRPCASSSGPPELPGLIAASVWTAPGMVKPLGESISRSSAETMPVVTVPESPNGLPIAIATSPGRSSAEEASSSGLTSAGMSGRIDLEHGEVGRGVLADQLGGQLLAVRAERDGVVRARLDDVLVGHDVALAVDEEAGAAALAGLDEGDGGRGVGVDLGHARGGRRRIGDRGGRGLGRGS